MDQFLDAEDAKAMKALKKKVDEVKEDDMFAGDEKEEDKEATNANCERRNLKI
jgi:hypothetical protein